MVRSGEREKQGWRVEWRVKSVDSILRFLPMRDYDSSLLYIGHNKDGSYCIYATPSFQTQLYVDQYDTVC